MRTLLPALCILSTAALFGQSQFIRIPHDPPFWIGQTEVTVAQFHAFVRATGFITTAEREHAERTWRVPGYKLQSRQPVVYVTLRDAASYCHWIGGRLPTDQEWDYAARAGAATRHYWGNDIDPRYLWFRANSNGAPQPVGTRLPNAWGLYDVEGNVWEWSLSSDVNGDAMGTRNGGSWIDCENIDTTPGKPPAPLISLSTHFRIPVKLDHRYDDIGFRCAR